MTDPIQNIKPFLAVAGALIALGIGWSELNARIDRKAERAAVDAVQQQVERRVTDLERSFAEEKRINRILLCRLPEIRPDSNCEDYRQ